MLNLEAVADLRVCSREVCGESSTDATVALQDPQGAPHQARDCPDTGVYTARTRSLATKRSYASALGRRPVLLPRAGRKVPAGLPYKVAAYPRACPARLIKASYTSPLLRLAHHHRLDGRDRSATELKGM